MPTCASPSPALVRGAVVSICLLLAGSAVRPESLSPHDVARLRSVSSVAISPDGGHAAYLLSVPRDPFAEEDGAAWSELHLWEPGRSTSRPYVTGGETLSAISWRPAHDEVAFLAERAGDEAKSLWSIAVGGGEARPLVRHATDISAYSFSPDGMRVAFLAKEEEPEGREELEKKGFDAEIFEEELLRTRVWVATLGDEGAEPRPLELEGSASELHWSPAGGLLAVALAPTSLIDDHYMRRQIHLVDADSGEVRGRVGHAAKLGAVAWSPDGRRLAMIAGEDLHDPKEGRLMVAAAEGGAPADLLPGYRGHVAAIAWRGPTEVVFVGDEGVWTTLATVEVERGDGAVERLAAGGPIWRDLAVSADGSTAVLRGDTPAHPGELFSLAWEGGEPHRLTDSNPWLAERELASQEPVAYAARDGLALEGLLVRPLGVSEGPVPVVLMVHGGPEAHYRNGWLTSYSRPAQVLAGRGIASFYPNYRGSTGRGLEFSRLSQGDPAGREFDDLVDAVDHLAAAGIADPKRAGITGGSYGGYATAWGSTYYSERFAAGVMFVGISNEISKVGTSDIPNELYLVHLRHWPWEKWQFALERSPIYYAEKARTPLLILHGKQDTRVFPGQSMELYRLLRTLGKTPVRLVFYPQEGHGNRRAAARLDYTLRLVRWMEHYLTGDGGEPPPPEIDPSPPAGAQAEGEEGS
ncbi:MAG: S9 family peptidase [Thermoanaerobaculia bacterium]|nr:S9 family peptidase [Thermoanaerobaculia bacterium]